MEKNLDWIGSDWIDTLVSFSRHRREEKLSAFASHGWSSYHWSTIACICIRVHSFDQTE